MTDYPVTDQHFETFKQQCWVAIRALHLDHCGFRIEFEATDDLDSGVYADTGYHVTQRAVLFRLHKTWTEEPTEALLDSIAQHEVLHFFLDPIASLARCRYVSQDEVAAGEHEVLNRLHKLLIDAKVFGESGVP